MTLSAKQAKALTSEGQRQDQQRSLLERKKAEIAKRKAETAIRNAFPAFLKGVETSIADTALQGRSELRVTAGFNAEGRIFSELAVSALEKAGYKISPTASWQRGEQNMDGPDTPEGTWYSLTIQW